MTELTTERMEEEEEEEKEETPVLPVEILVQIVSRLSMREAARTSAVCKRWRNVWTYTTALNFDESPRRLRRWRRSPAYWYSRKKWGSLDSFNYSNWVCWVLAQRRRGSRLDEFKVCHYLDSRHSSLIDDWIRHAFSSRVHTLELNLSNRSYWTAAKRPYTLQSPRALMAGGLGFKFLKTLALMAVNVGDEVVQSFLSDCPLLERLYLISISGLRNLRVVGRPSTLLLTHLKVEMCLHLELIEIRDVTNLFSFSYAGPANLNMVLKDAPKLVNLSLEPYCSIFELPSMFPKVSCCFSQLQLLRLIVPSAWTQERSMNFVLPEMKNLRIFSWHGVRELNLRRYVALINNLPNLEVFVLTLPECHKHVEGGEEDEVDEEEEEMSTEEREAMRRFRHPRLGVLYLFSGYCKTCDLVLIKQMMETAPKLMLICVRIDQEKEGWEMERSLVEQQLRPLLPSTVDLMFSKLVT